MRDRFYWVSKIPRVIIVLHMAIIIHIQVIMVLHMAIITHIQVKFKVYNMMIFLIKLMIKTSFGTIKNGEISQTRYFIIIAIY